MEKFFLLTFLFNLCFLGILCFLLHLFSVLGHLFLLFLGSDLLNANITLLLPALSQFLVLLLLFLGVKNTLLRFLGVFHLFFSL